MVTDKMKKGYYDIRNNEWVATEPTLVETIIDWMKRRYIKNDKSTKKFKTSN